MDDDTDQASGAAPRGLPIPPELVEAATRFFRDGKQISRTTYFKADLFPCAQSFRRGPSVG